MLLIMKEKILIVVEKCVCGVGFLEMSFRDLVQDVGIKSVSVYYYFLIKLDFGEVLVICYVDCFKEVLDEIDIDDFEIVLNGFVNFYFDVFVLNEFICLCVIMGVEVIGLFENVN